MKKWTYILAAIAVFDMGLSSIGWSIRNPRIQNPGIKNPAGMSTVPPSSLGSGLVTSPSPFNRTGNDAMTGNLRGARSFRGGVPYRSRSAFWGGLTSTEAINLRQVGGALSPANTLLGPTPDTASLDSFMRNSAGWEDFGTYSGKYMTPQYYSRKNAMPTTTPGRSGVFKPSNSRVADTVPDVFGLEVLPKQTSPKQNISSSNIPMRSTPLTSEEIRRLASGQARISPKNEPLAAEQYRKQIEQVRLDLIKMRSKTAVPQAPTAEDTQKEDLLKLLPKPSVKRTERDKELDQIQKLATPLDERPGPLQPQTEGLMKSQETKQNEKPSPGSKTLDKEALDKLLSPSMQKEPGVMPKVEKKGIAGSTADLEKLAEQIANLKRKGGGTTAESLQTGVGKTGAGTARVTGKYPLTEPTGSRVPGRALPDIGTLPDITLKSYKDLVLKNAEEPTDEVTRTGESEADKIKNLPDQEVSARAKQILGEHKNHKSLNQARFKKYMTEAQAYMKQGRYYQAVNAYEQASVFDSTKPAALVGRSLALFGAGEYMSSALFLARAIEMSEDFAHSKVDLAALMGDKDKLETRIADTEEWLERSCSPELEFLLAYMYHQNGRSEPATRAIADAAKEMPNSKAVKILKEVIDAKPKPPKKKK